MRVIGHRGARGEAPENTLGGFQYIQDAFPLQALVFYCAFICGHDPSCPYYINIYSAVNLLFSH